MRAIIDTNGIMRLSNGGAWAAAGVAGRGRTPGGAEVRWFSALALPVALLSPAQEAQHTAMRKPV